MVRKFKFSIRATYHSFGGAVCAGAVLLIASNMQAQNLFEGGYQAAGTGHIYEFTPNGAQTTFASGLESPVGLAFDSSGDLFEADRDGNIYEFTNNAGTLSSNCFVFASGLSEPEGLAFNSAGDLFEADGPSGNINGFSPSGTEGTFASGSGYPTGLAFNSAGDLFVANFDIGTITEITPGGTQTTFASGLIIPFGLAFNSAGDLFVSEFGSSNIYEYTTNGMQSTFASGLDAPAGLAFNSAGVLFVALGNNTILEITTNGTQSTFAVGLPGPSFLAFQPVLGPPPPLQIAPAGNQSVLFWAASSVNYTLQSTTNLASPNWVTISNCMPIVGFTLTNSLPAAYFRLSQP